MSFFKSLLDIADKINKAMSDQPSEKPRVVRTNPTRAQQYSSHDKPIYALYEASIKYNGNKYAVHHTGDKKSSDFMYDDVVAMSPHSIVLTVIRPDGSKRYAVASTHSGLKITEPEYIAVDFYDDSNLLLTDEDGDEYVINSSGDIQIKRIFDKELEEWLQECQENEKSDNSSSSYDSDGDDDDDDDGDFDFDDEDF